MKIFSALGLFSLTFILISSCGLEHGYNLSMQPPGNQDTPDMIFPHKINGVKAEITKLPHGGVTYQYGPNKSISVGRLNSPKSAISFFKKVFLPEYKTEGYDTSGIVNKQYFARANGKTKMFGWTNGNYAFSIKASSQEDLDSIISNFMYIEEE